MPHKLAGIPKISPKALDNPPWETVFADSTTYQSISTVSKRKDVIVFPNAKSSNFTLTMPSTPLHIAETNKSKTFHYKPDKFYQPNLPPYQAQVSHYKRPETFFSHNMSSTSSLAYEQSVLLSTLKENDTRQPQPLSVSDSITRTEGTGTQRNVRTVSVGVSSQLSNTSSAYANLPAALEPVPIKKHKETYDRFFNSEIRETSAQNKSKSLNANIGVVPLNVEPVYITQKHRNSLHIHSKRSYQGDIIPRNLELNTGRKDDPEMKDKTYDPAKKMSNTEMNLSNTAYPTKSISEPAKKDAVSSEQTVENSESHFPVLIREGDENVSDIVDLTNDDVSLPVSLDESKPNSPRNSPLLQVRRFKTSTPLEVKGKENIAKDVH